MRKLLFTLILFVSLLFLFQAFVIPTHAAGTSFGDIMSFFQGTPPGGVPSGGMSGLINAIRVFIELLIWLAIILCLFVIIWGGLSLITSEGDKQRIAQARQRIIFALIGLIIVFLAFFVINLINYFFFGPTGGMGVGGGTGPRLQ